MEKCDTVLKRCLDLEQLEIKPQSLFNAANNPALVSILINEFEMSKEAKPYYSGLSEKAEQLITTDKKACYLRLAQYMLKQYEDKWRRRLSHARQRRLLEKIIRFLDKAGGENAPDESADDVSLAKAKAHLYRSRMIRPKGFNVPAKKIEGLYKALDCCLASGNKWCRFYAGVIALELDRCGRPSDNLFENDRPGSQPANLFMLLLRATQGNPIETDFGNDKINFGIYRLSFIKCVFGLKNSNWAILIKRICSMIRF